MKANSPNIGIRGDGGLCILMMILLRAKKFTGVTPGRTKSSSNIGKITSLQKGASGHSLGFVNKNLGSSPGLLGQ